MHVCLHTCMCVCVWGGGAHVCVRVRAHLPQCVCVLWGVACIKEGGGGLLD